MFIKVVPNTKGVHDTCFCYLVESYRENGKIKHRTLKNFGLDVYKRQVKYDNDRDIIPDR